MDINKDFKCPICLEYCKEAVECCNCKNYFCKICLTSVKEQKCPLCRE